MRYKGMRTGRSLGRWLVLWLWILPGFVFLGCTLLPKKKVVVKEPSTQGAELQQWEDGVRAFQKGDFHKALDIFEALRGGGGSEEVRRKGLYGLACTRLILAEDSEAFQQALFLWEEWSRASPMETGAEDPRMMWPLLYRMKPPTEPHEAGPTKRRQSRKEAMCEKRLRDKERELQRLKQQMEALEAIHKHIQEKKKGVTSPRRYEHGQ